MILELHAIQSFPPANLNRDDTGAPKDCVFGTVRRARVSSQSFKRAMRLRFRETGQDVGLRTKRLARQLSDRIEASSDSDDEHARELAKALLAAEPLELTIEEDGDTAQLLFLRPRELDALAALALEHADQLREAAAVNNGGSSAAGKKPKTKLPKATQSQVEAVLQAGGSGLDVALFGRMIAEMPEGNVDAACHVAHAIGTHRLAAEFDYYTAVDDLAPDDNLGAEMIGTVQYNATCFYRYARLDTQQLAQNLGLTANDPEIGAAAVALSEAFATAMPSGKQASFAAYSPPSLILLVAREQGAWNLANAFLNPVRPEDGLDLAAASAQRLHRHFKQLATVYSRPQERLRACVLAVEAQPDDLAASHQSASTLEELLAFARTETAG